MDTVFVCRDSGNTPRTWLFEDASGLERVVTRDLAELRVAGMKPTAGDIRCIAWGHLTRMAVWKLRPVWEPAVSMEQKLSRVRDAMDSIGTIDHLRNALVSAPAIAPEFAPGSLFASGNPTEMLDAVAF